MRRSTLSTIPISRRWKDDIIYFSRCSKEVEVFSLIYPFSLESRRIRIWYSYCLMQLNIVAISYSWIYSCYQLQLNIQLLSVTVEYIVAICYGWIYSCYLMLLMLNVNQVETISVTHEKESWNTWSTKISFSSIILLVLFINAMFVKRWEVLNIINYYNSSYLEKIQPLKWRKNRSSGCYWRICQLELSYPVKYHFLREKWQLFKKDIWREFWSHQNVEASLSQSGDWRKRLTRQTII